MKIEEFTGEFPTGSRGQARKSALRLRMDSLQPGECISLEDEERGIDKLRAAATNAAVGAKIKIRMATVGKRLLVKRVEKSE